MKPTKMMPYMVVIFDPSSGEKSHYSFKTERQAQKFANGVQIGTNFKVGMYVSIKKAKRDFK